MTASDIRWKQRLSNLKQAFKQLSSAVELYRTRPLHDLEKQGLIQVFEFTHELAWNVIKDYFLDQGNPSITGSRDTSREAFQKGLIQNGEVWMEMIKSRNQTSHTYNQSVAEDIVEKVCNIYIQEFDQLIRVMDELAKK